MSTISQLFYPTSVAIVGASETPGGVGASLVNNLKSFGGAVYYVNPHHEELAGSPCYESLSALPHPPHVAVIATPSITVPDIVEEAGKKKIQNLIIISAGFRELGEQGMMLEKQIRDLASIYNLTIIGPNCLGVINPEINLNMSFAGSLPKNGSIAFVSQSGALMTSILDYANAWNLGFSKCVSIGNKTVINETDVLMYLASDEKTSVILLYVEDIEDAARFISVAKTITRGNYPKPIVMLKAGRTKEGAQATKSHTGAVGGVDRYYDALCHQSGVIRVKSISEFLTFGMIASQNPPPKGTSLGIVTNAGGPGVLATDESVEYGLVPATLSKESLKVLQSVLPNSSRVHNPIDVLGDADASRYAAAIETVSHDSNVHTMLVILTPQSNTDTVGTAKAIIAHRKDTPIVASFMGQKAVSKGVALLRNNAVAVTEYPEDAARALGRFVSFYHQRKSLNAKQFQFLHIDASRATRIIESFTGETDMLPERESGLVLSAYGFPLVRAIQASSEEEAIAAVKTLGVPCAMKISSPVITHKRDVGGVMLHVTPSLAGHAYQTIINNVRTHMPNAPISGVLIKEMAPLGLECIIGMIREPNFGTMIMVGMGGSYVEITKDVAFGVAPITKDDAQNMIDSLHGKAIFAGYRGSQPLDTDALAMALGRLSQLAMDMRNIMEIDINPIVLYPVGQGAKIVDVRMRIQK